MAAAPNQQQLQQQQRWLKDLGLPQQDLQMLSSQNIHSARDLLTQSPIDLMERLNIPLSHAQRLLQHTAMQVAPAYVTVSVQGGKAQACAIAQLHNAVPCPRLGTKSAT